MAKFFVGRFEPAHLLPVRAPHYAGFARADLVPDALESVHMAVAICELQPDGEVARHVHAFEEGFLVQHGNVVLELMGRAYQLEPGDYGVLAPGVEHCWHGVGSEPARWFEMLAPRPTSAHTVFLAAGCSAQHAPIALDLSDPRTRSMGHFEIARAFPRYAASSRDASQIHGVSIQPMLHAQSGADLLTLFAGELAVGAEIRLHDHPFEEFQLFVDGSAEFVLDGGAHRQALQPGDFVWTRVGISHAFANTGSTPLRWLETQAPQPPRQYPHRFVRDWEEFALRAGA